MTNPYPGLRPFSDSDQDIFFGREHEIDDLLNRGENDLHSQVVAVVERILLKRVLRETDWHLGRACERLGLNRSTLRYKLRDLGLNAERPGNE